MGKNEQGYLFPNKVLRILSGKKDVDPIFNKPTSDKLYKKEFIKITYLEWPCILLFLATWKIINSWQIWVRKDLEINLQPIPSIWNGKSVVQKRRGLWLLSGDTQLFQLPKAIALSLAAFPKEHPVDICPALVTELTAILCHYSKHFIFTTGIFHGHPHCIDTKTKYWDICNLSKVTKLVNETIWLWPGKSDPWVCTCNYCATDSLMFQRSKEFGMANHFLLSSRLCEVW